MNLEHYKKALLFKQQNMSAVPLASTAPQFLNYMNTHNTVSVEEEAILFYLLNDAFGRLCSQFDKKEDLPKEADALARLYLKKASESSARLFYYLLAIITRESRHAPSHCIGKLDPQYGVIDFVKTLKAKASSGTAAKILKESCSDTLNGVSLGSYAAGIVNVFKKWGHPNNFGGEPWADIAEVFRKVVFGEISLELMNDLSWALAHNNGPIFNKGMLYDHYTQEIKRILDVQRSGQILEYVANKELLVPTVDIAHALDAVQSCLTTPPNTYVDWYKVEALGALQKYPTEKEKQYLTYGYPATGAKHSIVHVTPSTYAKVVERAAA